MNIFDDKEVKRMSKVKNQFGKQRHQDQLKLELQWSIERNDVQLDAELGTENRKTHDLSNGAPFDGPLVASADQLDVKPMTLDPKPETDSLLGPNPTCSEHPNKGRREQGSLSSVSGFGF